MKKYLLVLLVFAFMLCSLTGCKKDGNQDSMALPDPMPDTFYEVLSYRDGFDIHEDVSESGIIDKSRMKDMTRDEVLARWGYPNFSYAGPYEDYQVDVYIYAAPDRSYGYVLRVYYKLDAFQEDSVSVKPSWFGEDKQVGAQDFDMESMDFTQDISLAEASAVPECYLSLYVANKNRDDLVRMWGEPYESGEGPWGYMVYRYVSEDKMLYQIVVYFDDSDTAMYGFLTRTYATIGDLDAIRDNIHGSGSYFPNIPDDFVPDELKK